MSKAGVVWVLCWALVGWSAAAVSPPGAGAARLFVAPAAFAAESTVALNDDGRRDAEVGYKLRARLAVRSLWRHPDHAEHLLEFQLLEPQLFLRGKHPNANFEEHKSIWDDHSHSTFYVHWKAGLVQDVYLDPIELPAISNYKKSLISLFQFQILDGEYNETDISGPCDVLYESLSANEFRKIKRRCAEDAQLSPGSARRGARYTLREGDGALASVLADEVLQFGPPGLGVKARSWLRLQRRDEPPPPPPAAASPVATLEAALAALPAALRPALPPLALIDDPALPDEDPDDDYNATLEELVEEYAALLEEDEEAGGGGTVRSARALLRLAEAARRAPPPALAAMLRQTERHPQLVGLCRAAGLSGSGAAFGAAAAALQLDGAGAGDGPAARALLAGAALAGRADAELAAHAARLALAAARRREPLAAAALPAAVAAARAADDAETTPHHAERLRDQIAQALAKCKDDECRVPLVRALGMARRADCAELLLELAERGGRAAALAALDALRPLAEPAAAALHYARRLRLQAIVLRPNRPLEVRAAALEVLVAASAGREVALGALWAALEGGPRELRRLMRQLLTAPPPAHAAPAEWQAAAGGSLALARPLRWAPAAAAAGWDAALASTQLAAGGLLRRGAVRLRAHHAPTNASVEMLSVEVWTRGLAALGGGEADDSLQEPPAADEPAAAGLALAVAGVPLPPVTLFDGQAELLGHVWSGTGSTDTPAARAAWPLGSRRAAPALLAGARADLRWRAAAALALDARGTASLWARSAAAALTLRAAAASRAALQLRVPWGRLRVVAAAAAEPRLEVRAHLDFYDAPALCVQVHTDDHVLTHETRLESRQGGRGLRVRRSRRRSLPAPGRSLALDARAHAACRQLAARDADDQ